MLCALFLSKGRHRAVVTEGMSNWKPTIEVTGVEEVVECRLCGCKSTDDVRGANAFVFIQKGFGYIQACKTCADTERYGQTGLMAILAKETRDRLLASLPQRHPETSPTALVVPCSPARAPTTLERLEHVAACSRWAREHLRSGA